MVKAVLVGVLVLVLAGCGCVVWAERGGPRWARVVAALTLAAGDLLRSAEQRRRRRERRERWLLGKGGSGESSGD
ncbi:hypothetical protein [Kitasatospora aureofaciens]|uniref:hypothetical protein n=1 Tax=Kitasatospora aureofaciens TaxID=1894 RepID=UPI000525844B|nr:hypothetical protein [Kitasatospora aureofaciens]HJD82473.1 hypothetical protein [Kitasatospora aureofaciens]